MPWNTTEGSDDYQTARTWGENEFLDQTCVVKREIGEADKGILKILASTDYKVHLGAKIYDAANGRMYR